jgi:hypothetical protein
MLELKSNALRRLAEEYPQQASQSDGKWIGFLRGKLREEQNRQFEQERQEAEQLARRGLTHPRTKRLLRAKEKYTRHAEEELHSTPTTTS